MARDGLYAENAGSIFSVLARDGLYAENAGAIFGGVSSMTKGWSRDRKYLEVRALKLLVSLLSGQLNPSFPALTGNQSQPRTEDIFMTRLLLPSTIGLKRALGRDILSWQDMTN